MKDRDTRRHASDAGLALLLCMDTGEARKHPRCYRSGGHSRSNFLPKKISLSLLAACNLGGGMFCIYIHPLRRIQNLTWDFMVWARGRSRSGFSMMRMPPIQMPAAGRPLSTVAPSDQVLIVLSHPRERRKQACCGDQE
jgi:hypothetical protein